MSGGPEEKRRHPGCVEIVVARAEVSAVLVVLTCAMKR
jgi:hypothetical protein